MLRLLALLLLLAAPVVHADLPATLSVRCTLTPSSVFDTANCDGDDGTAAIPLRWEVPENPIPSQVRVAGSGSYTYDLCQHLTQAGSPNADISVAPTGEALPTGWSLTSTNNCTLSYSSGADTAEVVFRATRSAATTDHPAVTISAEADDLGETLTEVQIGAFEPVPSCIRTGNSYALTGAGSGFTGTASQGIACVMTIAGDFTFTGRVASLTDNSQPFPQAGLAAFVSTDANAIGLTVLSSLDSIGTRVRTRTVTGGSLSSVALDATAGVPGYKRIYRSGSTLYGGVSADGVTYVDLANMVVGTGDLQLMVAASSQTTTAISTTIDNVVITETAPSTGGGGTPGAKKWHPGHYHKSQGSWNATGYCDIVTSQLTRATESSNLRGEWVVYSWGAIETNDGVYDWSCVDSHVAYMASIGKYLIVDLAYKVFSTSPGNILPADLLSRVVTGTGAQPVQIAPIWETDMADRYIRFLEAFAARYDANPNVEMVQLSESAPSFGGGSPSATYSTSALATQLGRIYAAAAAAFDQTIFAPMINSLSNQAAGLVETAYGLGLGIGNPDAFDDAGSQIFAGTQVAGQGTTVRDYRGLIPREAKASAPVLGGKDDNGPATNIIDWAQLNDVTHLSWVSSVTVAGNTWNAILAAIAADPILFTACPSAMTCQ